MSLMQKVFSADVIHLTLSMKSGHIAIMRMFLSLSLWAKLIATTNRTYFEHAAIHNLAHLRRTTEATTTITHANA